MVELTKENIKNRKDGVEKDDGKLKGKSALKEGIMVLSAVSALGLAACTEENGTRNIPEPDADVEQDGDVETEDGNVPDAEIELDGSLDADDGGMPDAEIELDGSLDADNEEQPLCGETEEETWEGYIRAGEEQEVGGYVFAYLGEGGNHDGRYTIRCVRGDAVVVENEVFEDRETTVIEVPEDGKKISVYPRTTNPGSAEVTITVENLPSE
ncbi:hypothetical protein KKB44_02560 [Candidatus Micrarchaeota archaeon]|nr:hypothetical protein [Candidatus Micrarchaeota archaeon]